MMRFPRDLSFASIQDQNLMDKVMRVVDSVTDEKQLPALKKYCELAKRRMIIKAISNHHIDMMYSDKRRWINRAKNRKHLYEI